jgi:Xaa-Pro aminopeptidase
MTCGEVFSLALTRAEALGIGDSFMRFHSGAGAHFVGHGSGLELNEPPLLSRNNGTVLKAGMALVLEMHLMEPGGLALKLEDTVLVMAHGVEILTSSPRELMVVWAGKTLREAGQAALSER